MGSNVDTVKERLDIAEVISGYVKLEKAGNSLKGKCPFHNEKTPSFFVSPTRQSYYCFGCGEKGDIITFVEKMEGLDFRAALKLLADRAGVELEYVKPEIKNEKDVLHHIMEESTLFFEKNLLENSEARQYLEARGLTSDTIRSWRIGYAPGPPKNGWRSLYMYLMERGFKKNEILQAGVIKDTGEAGKEAYDVFRDRLIFPLADTNGRIIAFSGRALAKETEPKYLNSPDTPLFRKSEVLYGLDKAKEEIRKKNYAVLVEGQMDLVLSHQAGVKNTVASSGTAFTSLHLQRLKKLSSRIILAFDGDAAGVKAGEKASVLGISMGFEVKATSLPEGADPADLASKNPEDWKNALRESLPAIELFLKKAIEQEKDSRKLGKNIEQKILPMVKLVNSSIEQAYYVSQIAKLTGIKEEVLWDDLKKVPKPVVSQVGEIKAEAQEESSAVRSRPQKEIIEERLSEIALWQKELPENSEEFVLCKREEQELKANLSEILMREELNSLKTDLARAEKVNDSKIIKTVTEKIQYLLGEIRSLEEKRKVL